MDQTSLKKIASLRELILATLILMIVLYTFFKNFYGAQSKAINDLKTQKQTLEAETKTLQATLEALRAQNVSKRKVVKVDSPNVKIQILKGGRHPEFSKLNDFLEQITSPNFQKQLKLNEITNRGTTEGKGFTTNPVFISASGAFDQIAEFLRQLDDLPALVSVDSLFLTIAEETPNMMNLELNTTFYQVEGINAANETPNAPQLN